MVRRRGTISHSLITAHSNLDPWRRSPTLISQGGLWDNANSEIITILFSYPGKIRNRVCPFSALSKIRNGTGWLKTKANTPARQCRILSRLLFSGQILTFNTLKINKTLFLQHLTTKTRRLLLNQYCTRQIEQSIKCIFFKTGYFKP